MARSYLYRLEVKRDDYDQTRELLRGLGVLSGSTEFESTRPKRIIFEFVLPEDCSRKDRRRIEEAIRKASSLGETVLVRLPAALLYPDRGERSRIYMMREMD